MPKPVSFKPGDKIKLADIETRKVEGDWEKETAYERIAQNTTVSRGLAYRLYAENRRAVLLVLQGMDTAGKDGTIRTVMTGINPQSCQITPFKQPSHEEQDHGFLWRIHRAVPRRGNIGIFNRSHYEDVLVVRVKGLAPKDVWKKRYDHIRHFEQMLADEGTHIVKIFLNVSKEKQRERFEERLERPDKRWKFRAGDLDDRALWDDYMKAYTDALEKTSTDDAPWYVVPADRKWARNVCIARILRHHLERIDPQYPEPDSDIDFDDITIT